VIGTTRIRHVSIAPRLEPSAAGPDRSDGGTTTMRIAHAIAVAGLAALATDRIHTATETEIRAAEQRVVERRTPDAVPSGRREYTERGRHAAPRPARA
jgi:hypothetical protein